MARRHGYRAVLVLHLNSYEKGGYGTVRYEYDLETALYESSKSCGAHQQVSIPIAENIYEYRLRSNAQQERGGNNSGNESERRALGIGL